MANVELISVVSHEYSTSCTFEFTIVADVLTRVFAVTVTSDPMKVVM